MLRHRLLGPTGLRVSELCLGTMTFGETRNWGASEETARAILSRFADAGGSFLDTAPNYAGGAAEQIIGAFIAGNRDRWVVATKYTAISDPTIASSGNGRKAMRASVDASLRRLGTDHIDLLWLHYWDGTAPLEEILRGLDDLVRAGKVLHVGLSDTPAWLVSRAATIAELRNLVPIAAVQLEYNLAARTPERDLLPMAEALGLSPVCWGPLAAGALAGGASPQRRATASLPAPLAAIVERARSLAMETDRSLSALVLGWLLQHRRYPGLIPIVGARTPDQLEAALAAAAQAELPEVVMTALDTLAPIELGFPHDLIKSSYLRKLATGGDPKLLIAPNRPRA